METIKKNYKGKLVSVILAGYLSLKRLVVQRTKRIDESQELLLQMLEELTSGTEQEREEFMATCVETLKRFKDSDLLTPIFVFERLCNIIHPVRYAYCVQVDELRTCRMSILTITIVLSSFELSSYC